MSWSFDNGFCDYIITLFLGACMMPSHLSMVTEYMEMARILVLLDTYEWPKKQPSWHRRLKILHDICRCDQIMFFLLVIFMLFPHALYFL